MFEARICPFQSIWFGALSSLGRATTTHRLASASHLKVPEIQRKLTQHVEYDPEHASLHDTTLSHHLQSRRAKRCHLALVDVLF